MNIVEDKRRGSGRMTEDRIEITQGRFAAMVAIDKCQFYGGYIFEQTRQNSIEMAGDRLHMQTHRGKIGSRLCG